MAGWNNTILISGQHCSVVKTLYELQHWQRSAHVVAAPKPYKFEHELRGRTDARRLIVVKQVQFDSAVYDAITWEEKVAMLERLNKLDHENVLKYFGLSTEDGSDLLSVRKIFMHMEYCTQTDLKTYIIAKDIGLTEKFVLGVARRVLSGLAYLHNLEPVPIIHTDVKATNVFVTANGQFRIGDMDNCVSQSDSICRSTLSARTYGVSFHMSPEMCGICLKGEPAKVSRKTDVWSFGCMMVDIITNGNLRYVDHTGSVIDEDSIKHMQSVFEQKSKPDMSGVPSFYHPWLTRSLEQDVERRPYSNELFNLIHSFSMMAGWNNAIKVGGEQYSIVKTLYNRSRSVHIVTAPEPYQFECELKDRVDASRLIVVKQVQFDSAVYYGEAWKGKMAVLNRLSTLNHENVLKYFGLSTEDGSEFSTDKMFSIHMEYCANTDLKTYIKKMDITTTEDFVLGVAQRVLSGLVYLHNLEPTPIIHTDLKAFNIFVTANGDLRIGDMDDCACRNGDVSRSTLSIRMYGTSLHMSPEMCGIYLNAEPARVSRKTDVWSFACMMVDIITDGKLQYVNSIGNVNDEGSVRLMQLVYKRKSKPDLSGVPSYYHQWLIRSLEPDVEKRPHSDEILSLVEHRLRDLNDYIGIDFGSGRIRVAVSRHEGAAACREGCRGCLKVETVEMPYTSSLQEQLEVTPNWAWNKVNYIKMFDGADFEKAVTLVEYYRLPATVSKLGSDSHSWAFERQRKTNTGYTQQRITLLDACRQPLVKALVKYNKENSRMTTHCVITSMPNCFRDTEGLLFDSKSRIGPVTHVAVPDAFCTLLLQSSLWSTGSENSNCKDVFVVDMGVTRKPVTLYLRQKNVRIDEELLLKPYPGPWTAGIDATHAISKIKAQYKPHDARWSHEKPPELIADHFHDQEFKNFLTATKETAACLHEKNDAHLIGKDVLCRIGRRMGDHVCKEIVHIMAVCTSMNYHIKDYCILVTGRASRMPEAIETIQSQFMGHVVCCDQETETPVCGAALCGQLLRDCAEEDRPSLMNQLQDPQENILYNRGRLLVVNKVSASPLENLRQLINPKPAHVPELWHICNSRHPNLALVCRRGSDAVWLEEINVDNDDHKWRLCPTLDFPDTEFSLLNFGFRKWLGCANQMCSSLAINSSRFESSVSDHGWKLLRNHTLKDDSTACLVCTTNLALVVDTTLAHSVPNTTTPLKSKELAVKDKEVPQEFTWKLVKAY